jgi:hypothetical protein
MLDKVVYELNHGDPKSLRKRYVLADDLMSPVGASSLSLRMFINHELLALRTTLSGEYRSA